MTKRIRESERFAFAENKRMELVIRGKRIRTAAFSYSLILLFSALGAAQGAKMCRSVGNSLSFQRGGNFFWARGTGCKGVWNEGFVDVGLDLAGVIATCDAPLLAGTSSCWTSSTSKPSGKGFLNGPHCWCKLLYPVETDWVFYLTAKDGAAINCNGGQVNDCTAVCSYSGGGYEKLLAF